MKRVKLYKRTELGEYQINPILKGQVFIGIKETINGMFQRYKFAQGHFEFNIRQDCLMNIPIFIDYNGHTHILYEIAHEAAMENTIIYLFDPNSGPDKEILGEISYYERQEHWL